MFIIIGLLSYIEKDFVLNIWKSLSMTQRRFQKGDEVIIEDLILSPQYNNFIGIIASDLDRVKKRFAVKLMYHVPDKYITVKPGNLSFLTNKKQIESILRNIGHNENSKYVVNGDPNDFIHSLATKYRSRSLPALNRFLNASFKHYHENCDSVYVMMQYLALFSSINKYNCFKPSFWNQYIDRYTAMNKLKLFTQVHIEESQTEKLSILFMRLFNHKLCILRYKDEFRVIQSISDICKYSLIQELNARDWCHCSQIEHVCDALMDVVHCKKLNQSQWLFGEQIEDQYMDDHEDMTEQLQICILEDLNVEMFIKSAHKMLRYIARFCIDDEIIIKCV